MPARSQRGLRQPATPLADHTHRESALHTWVARRFPTHFRRRSPAPMVLALVCVAFAALSAAAQDTPKWLQELRKDFANIDKARKNHAELHRGLVRKWKEDGRIGDVLREYDARGVDYADDAPTHARMN